jgi:hypothetical protein
MHLDTGGAIGGGQGELASETAVAWLRTAFCRLRWSELMRNEAPPYARSNGGAA